MNIETIVLSILFTVILLAREFVHYKEIQKLTNKPTVKEEVIDANGNKIMDNNPNEIAYDDPEFDFVKANKVIIDGQERPLEII